MIVINKLKKRSSFWVGVSKIRGALPKLKVHTIPAKYGFKKATTIILCTILVWSFLLASVIYRQSHKEGFKGIAFALNLKGREIKHDFFGSTKAIALAPYHWATAHLSGHDAPKIHIDIKFKHIQKLFKKREEAMKIGFLKQAPDDYVPAQIRREGKTAKVKLRLKGDQTDHLEGDKWSFRIHVKGEDHLFGIRHFSIQKPRTRNYEGEVLFFEALRREGVLVPRYFFVDVSVNGKDIGLMALEEHFSKEILESQGRKESVIIRFDESMIWEPNTDGLFNNFKVAKITPFRSKKVLRSQELKSYLKIARGLLRGFANGSLPASQVFDAVLMGRFIAVADVWRAWHQLGWHNIRFYYNPITSLLEPIGYDASIPYKDADVPPASEEPIVSALLNGDAKVRLSYEETVKKLAQEMEDGTSIAWVQPLANKQLRILHKEYPLLKGLRFDLIAERSKAVLQRTRKSSSKYPQILQAYSIDLPTENNSLELINPLNHVVEIHEIKYVNPVNGEEIDFPTRSPISYPVQLKPTPKGGIPRIHKIFINKNQISEDYEIRVGAKVSGEDSIRWVTVQPYSPVLKNNSIPQMDLNEVLIQHPFLKLKAGTNFLKVSPGTWEVKNWLLVPEGLELRIPKGTTLQFNESIGLIARGPIMIEGTEDAPVVLMGSGKTKSESVWQGIAVMKTGKPSVWSHVVVRDTAGISHKGWNLTGGVNFYEADIQMKEVTLTGNRTEDALNIVRSKFELDSVTIKNAASDAFDSDFSNGVVRGGLYENIGHASGGGDGIDVSGSEVTVTGTVFENISDKALSVGEKSVMTASNISMERVGVGAVSKDGSHLTLTDAKISFAKIAGLMTYIKKPEYGAGTLVAKNIKTKSVPQVAISQKGNTLTMDSKLIEPEELGVDELYETRMKSKAKN
jgi:hypothetical protein